MKKEYQELLDGIYHKGAVKVSDDIKAAAKEKGNIDATLFQTLGVAVQKIKEGEAILRQQAEKYLK